MRDNGRWPRDRVNRVGALVGCCGFALAALTWLCPARLIVQGRPEHSIPFHVALRLNTPRAWERGQLVQFRVRDLRPYYPAGTMFTKLVAGLPKDRLQLDGRTFRVNGAVVGRALETDAQGRPARLYVPARTPEGFCSSDTREPTDSAWADCLLPSGTLFVLGVHERSFDSRYWGLVHLAEVTGRVVPLF